LRRIKAQNPADWGIFHPPWFDSGSEYGPETPGAWEAQLERFEMTTAGGGLWDEEAGGAWKGTTSARSGHRRLGDRDAVLRALAEGQLTEVESRVVEAVYARRVDLGDVPRAIAMTERAVNAALVRARRRARRLYA
jgi:hypothetical protein